MPLDLYVETTTGVIVSSLKLIVSFSLGLSAIVNTAVALGPTDVPTKDAS